MSFEIFSFGWWTIPAIWVVSAVIAICLIAIIDRVSGTTENKKEIGDMRRICLILGPFMLAFVLVVLMIELWQQLPREKKELAG